MTAADKTFYSKKARLGILLAHLIEMMKVTDRAICREMQNGRDTEALKNKYNILNNGLNKIARTSTGY